VSDARPRNVVVDTNIHFSAWRTSNGDSPCKEVVVRGMRKDFRLVVSPALLAEIYEKMTEDLKISEDRATRYISLLAARGTMYRDVDNEIVWCTDPDDAYLFVLMHHSGAWCIVAYDSIFFEPRRRLSSVEFQSMKPVPFLVALRELRGETIGSRAASDGSLDVYAETASRPSALASRESG
jgi:predicted nucleic acid-binding protein